MPSPPDPLVSAQLLALLARLRWRSIGALGITATELGYFFTESVGELEVGLYLDAGERWGVYQLGSIGLGPFAVTEATARVLASATLGEDGLLVHQGSRFHLRALFERGHLTAVLVHAEPEEAKVPGEASAIEPNPYDPHVVGTS